MALQMREALNLRSFDAAPDGIAFEPADQRPTPEARLRKPKWRSGSWRRAQRINCCCVMRKASVSANWHVNWVGRHAA